MTNLIAAQSFCTHYNIQYSFLEALQEHDLIEISIVEEKPCISEEALPWLEKMVRLHYDLDINVEGLETVTHLLQRIQQMQDEINYLHNKLSLYER